MSTLRTTLPHTTPLTRRARRLLRIWFPLLVAAWVIVLASTPGNGAHLIGCLLTVAATAAVVVEAVKP